MQKIVSVYQRNYTTDRLIRDEATPGAEWVLAGEGRATRKYDGTCAMAENGRLFKRFELKARKISPVGFMPAQSPDPVTGDIPGWLPVADGPEDQWFRNALAKFRCATCGHFSIPDGTYELCGPHVQGNPEQLKEDQLIAHGSETIPNFPRGFNGMRDRLSVGDIEGIVFWHDDGRKAKIKAKDFGFKRIAHATAGQ